MLSPGDKVLVAFSGGADSSVLLDVLVRLSKELGISVSAAHLNHMLRGDDAMKDEEFARKKCSEYGIEFACERADVSGFAKQTGQSVELAARNIRYDFLRRAKEKFGADKIATAHNANDNLETILFNISRGSGIDGICGIPPVRDDIIRPIIEITRTEIEEYAKEQKLQFCTDKTNDETIYSRNKLRHEAMPVLSEINPAAVENACRMSRLLRDDAEFLKAFAENAANEVSVSETACKREKLSALHDAMFGRVCEIFAKKALQREDYTLEYKHISDIRKLSEGGTPSGELHLPAGLLVRCEYDKIVFEKKENGEELLPQKLEIGKNIYGGYVISLKKAVKPGKINNSVNTFFVLYDRISGDLFVRPRNTGDSIRLKKRPEKSIKKLFVDEKVPKQDREGIPIIADCEKVIAVSGFGVDERVMADAGQECLEIRIEKE